MKESFSKSEIQKNKKIVVFFHGYGKDKELFAPVGRIVSRTLKNADVHIPQGIQPCEDGEGYQWFPFRDFSLSSWKDAYYEVEPKLIEYMEKIIGRKNLDYDNVILSGFSQGAMVALMLGLKLHVGAIISFSGILLDVEVIVPPISTKILMIHGANDKIIPLSEMQLSAEALKNRKIDTDTFIDEDGEHGINISMIRSAVRFLKQL